MDFFWNGNVSTEGMEYEDGKEKSANTHTLIPIMPFAID